jgi:hypothetical protein
MLVFTKQTRELLFVVLIFSLYFLSIRLRHYINKSIHVKKKNIVWFELLISFVFTAVISGLYYLVHLSGTENFWDVTPAAKCKGGPYFWQGDSETSKMCRELASTPEGLEQIAGYNCPNGEVGQPGSKEAQFVYTPLSGDDWTNEQCNTGL